MVDFWKDPVMLAAGNVRGLPRTQTPDEQGRPQTKPGGDPDFPEDLAISDGTIRGNTYTEPVLHIPDLSTLTGDLNAHADRLGIPVAELVAARHTAGRGGLLDLLTAVRKRFTS